MESGETLVSKHSSSLGIKMDLRNRETWTLQILGSSMNIQEPASLAICVYVSAKDLVSHLNVCPQMH